MEYTTSGKSINDVMTLLSNKSNEVENKIREYEALQLSIQNVDKSIAQTNARIKLETEMESIFRKASETLRQKAKVHFEKIVTDALQFVTQDRSTKFVIEESIIRNKPAYEFYVETMVNGEVSKQKPEDACGGGFIDIISVTLKYAYLQIFGNPEIKNACLILDEPGKMISEQMSVKFAEYIKFLGKHFGKQTIMITHNENLSNIANKTFYVQKNRSGVSHVSDISNVTVEMDLVNNSVKEIMDENITE
jgi:DNA repair exonuclease SbcCD ATPase subunit